ncbi:MAG: dTDP-4-dehydrorhamnose reductase [Planctomycetota bacterium]|nr:dTDP-4-dehydrorhamnose reductase [Planctomycetota bacterium]MDI6788641.1 dTDP-4-dehydrorhamnose reductase [Planctomycetota bacterium]
MKIIIIGANGQLGTDLLKVFSSPIGTKNRWQVIGLTISDIDITDFSKVRQMIEEKKPDIVINTAAYHNVPECEKNPQEAFLVNTLAVRNLANLCRTFNIKLVHFSTDYVFDGRKMRPYNEDDTPNPLNVYATSKLAGEYFVKLIPDHYIIRVASLFGLAGCMGKGGTNFVESMLNVAKTNKTTVQVTSNITSSPTYTYDAALKIREMIEDNYPPGPYHLTNSGYCTWFEFAAAIFRESNIKIRLEPREEKEEEAGVKRPLFSALTSKKLTALRPWQEALKHYMASRK